MCLHVSVRERVRTPEDQRQRDFTPLMAYLSSLANMTTCSSTYKPRNSYPLQGFDIHPQNIHSHTKCQAMPQLYKSSNEK